MRLLKVIFVLVAVVTIGFLVTGIISPKEFHGQVSITLPESKVKVWNMLTDIKHIPDRHKEIYKLEMLGLNSKGNPYWKEYTSNEEYMVFEIDQQEYPNKLVINMTESTFGMTGTWNYLLEGNDSITNLKVTEDSKVDNFTTRAILTMTGRGHFLKREISSLKESMNSKQ